MFLRNIRPQTKSMFTLSFRNADVLNFASLSSDSFTSSRAQVIASRLLHTASTDSALADHLVFDRFFQLQAVFYIVCMFSQERISFSALCKYYEYSF